MQEDMKISLIVPFVIIISNTYAYEFENTTCFTVNDGSAQSISSIQIGEAMILNSAADKPSHWTQNSNSLEFVKVKYSYFRGPGSEANLRIINGKLHETFMGSDGVKVFRRIVPRLMPELGSREQVGINGSRLEYNLVSQLECQKSIF